MACGLGAGLAFMAGSVALILFTDPLFTTGKMSDTGQVVVSGLVMACYFILAGIVGLGLMIRTSKKDPFKYQIEAILLMVLPAAFAILSVGMLSTIPYVRGLLASLPVMGAGHLAWSAGTSPYSGNEPSDAGIFRWGLGAHIVLPLVITGLFEVLNDASKVAGIAVVCPALAFQVVLFIAQGLVAYRLARRRWGPVVFPRKGPEGRTRPADGAAPPDGHAQRPALASGALAVLVMVFVMMLVPAFSALASPPRLHIERAEGHFSDGKVGFEIQVVNRGGLEAAGRIEVWLENATIRLLAGTLDGLGGYDLWNLAGELPNESIGNRTRLDAVLVCNGEERDRMALLSPSGCLMILVLPPVALAAAALSGARRKELGNR